MIAMGISAAVCFLFPLAVLLYFKKKEDISLKPVFVGMAVFFVFTQVLERLLHQFVIGNNLISNTWFFALYGALAAGVFEETGRFIAFKTILKKRHEWKDGIAFGIGHGGIEAILIGAVAMVQYMVYSSLINRGLFDAALGPAVPAAQIVQLKQALTGLAPWTIMLGVVERVFAFGIQMALTMVVLYAVRYRKTVYLFVAILLHALVDIFAALYQTGVIKSILAVEGIVALFFIASVAFLLKTKRIFSRESKDGEGL